MRIASGVAQIFYVVEVAAPAGWRISFLERDQIWLVCDEKRRDFIQISMCLLATDQQLIAGSAASDGQSVTNDGTGVVSVLVTGARLR